MTILFLGNFRASHCSEVHYKQTLEKMGHSVIALQESEATGEDIINYSKNVDYFFFVHTHGWQTPGLNAALAWLKKIGVTTFGYHLDLYMGLERESAILDYPAKLDHFFTVDKLMADWLNTNTTTKGHYLPAGVFEEECYMAEPDYKKYPHPIVFTGAKGYHPEWPYRPQLIEWLQFNYGDMFAHYGNGGGKPTVRGHDLNTLYASAKIAVGDTLCKNFDYPYYSSDRYWESMGRGAFLIYPKITGLDLFCTDKKEVVYYRFGDFKQLRELIDYYLSANDEREAIRKAGHERVKSIGTYTVRLKQLLETLQNETKR